MDKKIDNVEVDNRTGGETFLDLVAKQAMHNFVNGDKESLRVAREVEKEKEKFKPLFAEAENDKLKNEKNKNGRNKR